MNFYEILKTKKLGRGSPDYWTQLFAEHAGGKGEWKVAELTGTLPMTFRSNGTALVDYRIFGTADGAGVQTENLVEGIIEGANINEIGTIVYNSSFNVYVAKIVEGQEYTITAYSGYVYGFFGALPTINSQSYDRERKIGQRTFTAPIDGYIAFRSAPSGTNVMLTEGSIPPETYIPYGYKLPLTVTSGTDSKTTDVYIGDSKLLSGDYADYKSSKIYKAKRVHEDTVTIDGIEWDILDYDHDEVYKADGTRAKRTVTIQTHDVINELQYSARQAAFAFPDGLAAGTYKFTVGAHPWVAGDVNKVLTFTLTNDIAAGGQLVFNGSYNATLVGATITAFTSATSTTAAETVTMIEGNTGTDLGTIRRSKTDAINSIDRALLGSNNWLESAMRQYLNSDKAAGSVWTPQSVFDRPPTWASATAGFLNEKSADFLSHIGTAKKTTGLNSISDGGGTAVHDEKFFLLSRSEVYMGDEYTGGEDTPYAYYKNYSDNQSASTGADKNRIKYRAGAAKYWWLRSAYAGTAYYVRFVISSGAWSADIAAHAHGVAPACCIVLDDMNDWVKQTFYTENTVDLPAIETFSGENTLDSTETVGEVTIKGQIKPQS